MKLAAALLILGSSWANADRVDYRPQPNGNYRVRVGYFAPIKSDACGLVQVGSSTSFIEWPHGSGETKVVEIITPSIPGMPDLIIRSYCLNEVGRSELSPNVGCVDAGTDCERKCGDIRFDYKISLADFAIARFMVSSTTTRWEANRPWCDVTGDQLCTLADFARIRKAVAGRDTSNLMQECPGLAR